MNKDHLISSSLFTGVRTVLNVTKNLLIVSLFTKILGSGIYGQWTSIIAVVGLASSFGDLHLNGSLIRFSSKWNSEKQVISDILFLTLFTSIISSVIFYIVESYYGVVKNAIDLTSLSLLLSVFVGIEISFRVITTLPRARNNILEFELLKIFSILLTTGVLFISIMYRQSLNNIVFYYLCSRVCIILIVLSFNLDYMTYPKAKNFSKYLRYGTPMIGKEISMSFLDDIDKYLIAYYISPVATGIYSASYGIGTLLYQFTNILNPVLYPSVTKAFDNGQIDTIKETYLQIFRIYIGIALPATIGLALVAKPLISLITTPSIAAKGWVVVPISSLGFFLRGLGNPLEYILTATQETNKLGLILIVSSVLNVIINIIIIPVFSLYGAAFSTSVSFTMVFILTYIYAKKKINIAIPFAILLKTSVATLLMAIPLVAIRFQMDGQVALLILPILGVSIYFPISFAMGIFTRREIELVKIW